MPANTENGASGSRAPVTSFYAARALFLGVFLAGWKGLVFVG
ncbi:MAG: hypothetical protein ACYDA4_11705 [Ignavibacteriaceae bacterium]